jgi:hypothetical protein
MFAAGTRDRGRFLSSWLYDTLFSDSFNNEQKGVNNEYIHTIHRPASFCGRNDKNKRRTAHGFWKKENRD